MASIFSDGALHPGRDPNDSSWVIVRTAHDWSSATLRGTAFDPARSVIELAPRSLAADATTPLEVTAPDGTVYRSDPDRDLVLRRGSCDTTFVRLPHFGGRGTMTGRLRRPLGLALDDRGYLYVADADNHRVQVVTPADGAVEIVLDAGMTEPIDVAVGRTAIYIADRGSHRIHVFDRWFRWLRAFAAEPVAIAVDADDALLIAEASSPRLRRFDRDGRALADLPFDAPGVPTKLAGLAAAMRFAASGDVIAGPIDGRTEDLAWHRVIVDAVLPAGTRLEIQTFASDDPAASGPIPWAPAAPIAMPIEGDELARPVLSDTGRWSRARHGAYRRATPTIAEYDGDGPFGSAMLVLRADALPLVRVGDVVELAAAAPSTAVERATIAVIPPRTVRLAAHGAMVAYGPGTEIVVRQRDGHEPFGGPRAVWTLQPGESLDLSTVTPDGTLFERLIPHAVAALWRRGDVLDVLDGATAATILVDDIEAVPSAIGLAAIPAADYRSSVVRLIDTRDRLLVRGAGLDASTPPEEPITIDGITGGVPWTTVRAVRWVEPEHGAVWLAPGPMIDFAAWESFTTPIARATDRGRYLWLRLHLVGATVFPDDDTATATPTIRSVRLVRPRLSYLRYLPATFARRDGDDPTGALFVERMLALFEQRFTQIESTYESIARQLDPFAADPEWVEFVASWFALTFDPELPHERRVRLLAEVHELYARRGTPAGIRRYVELVTGFEPVIVEGFQLRPRSGLILGSGVLGCAELGVLDETAANSAALLDRFAHRFTLYVFVADPCRRAQVEATMRGLLPTIVPAHTVVDLQIVDPDARAGTRSTVGIDFVLGADTLERRALGNLVLGLDPVLDGSHQPPSR